KSKEPGVYLGQCADHGGHYHSFMPILVDDRTEEDYRACLQEKQAAAAAIRELTSKTFTFDELYARGEEVYNRSCAACHQVNGEGIPGTFPSLKGVGVAVGPIDHHCDVVA